MWCWGRGALCALHTLNALSESVGLEGEEARLGALDALGVLNHGLGSYGVWCVKWGHMGALDALGALSRGGVWWCVCTVCRGVGRVHWEHWIH